MDIRRMKQETNVAYQASRNLMIHVDNLIYGKVTV